MFQADSSAAARRFSLGEIKAMARSERKLLRESFSCAETAKSGFMQFSLLQSGMFRWRLNSQAICASTSRSRQAKGTSSGNQQGDLGRRDKWNRVRIGVASHGLRENAHAR